MILIVVVRYNTPLMESPTIATLSTAFREHPELQESYRVLIWDNSTTPADCENLPFRYRYVHAEQNLGVSGAYNGAMKYALEQKWPWMLLLDQDTKVSSHFLHAMVDHCNLLLPRHEIAAIAPTILVGKTVVSPTRRLLGRVRTYPPGENGIAQGEASAINSGCVIRVEALQNIGGFSADFWLDYSDIYVFHQFFLRGMKVWRAADIELLHDLSMMDYANQMTPWRCKNFSRAETAFHDRYGNTLENAALTLRLLGRAIKHKMRYDNPEFARIAWALFLYRIKVPRAKRVLWQFTKDKAGKVPPFYD